MKIARVNGMAAFLVLIAVVPLISQQPATNTAAAAPSTGTKIGTMIKDAISVAAPGIGQIISLVWPNAQTKANETKKAADATQALTNGQAALTKSVQAQAKAKLQPTTQIADELAVVQKFAQASALASPHLVAMQTLLTASPQPKDLLKRLQEEWDLTATSLAPVFVASIETDIKKVRETAVKEMLLQIHQANTGVSGRIAKRVPSAKAITDLDLPALKDLVVTLSGLLDGAQTMAAAELDNLQQEIAAVAAWANGGAQGLETPTVIVTKPGLLKVSRDAVTTAKATLVRIK